MKILQNLTNRVGSFFGVSMARINDQQLSELLYAGSPDFSDMDLSGKKLGGIIRDRMSIQKALFCRALLKGVHFGRHFLTYSDFTGADMTGVQFVEANTITYCKFDKACGIDMMLKACVVDKCSFAGTDLRHAEFNSCSIKRCDFRGAKINGTKFDNCTFEHVVFDPNYKLVNGVIRKV